MIAGIILLLGAGVGGYLAMKKAPSQTSTEQVPSPAVGEKKESKPETISGTLKSLLTGGKSLKCTFSNKIETTVVEGTIYAAEGKMRGDFKTTADKTAVNGHMIVDSKFSYVWNDISNQGFKVAVSEAEKASNASSAESNALDLNETLNYNCENWNKDDSVFNVPSNITFQSFTIPQVTGVNKETTSSQCSACDSLPVGSAKDACLTQLNCK